VCGGGRREGEVGGGGVRAGGGGGVKGGCEGWGLGVITEWGMGGKVVVKGGG